MVLVPKNARIVQRFTHSNKDVMKNLLKVILLATVAIFTFSLNAQEFTHFKLKSDSSQASRTQMMARDKGQPENIAQKITAKILDLDLSQKSTIEDNTPPLLQKIMQLLGTSYNQIGQEQTQRLLLSHDLGGGILNFSGFTWQKPLANMGLFINRELAPDLFSDRWIVHDTLLIRVSASTLLTNLRAADLIDISDEGIGAFAGITFQRTYRYYHFAETFLAGLTADYSKLFLSFTKFNTHHVLNLAPYELMKKADEFTFNAGGFVTSPPFYGFSARAGVLVQAAFENELTIQSMGPADQAGTDEFLRLSIDKKWDVSAAAHLSLQVDFFNLLKLTILSYDLEYSYGKSNKHHLSFYEQDKQLIENSKDHQREFKRIIAGVNDEVQAWKKNIVQQDIRMNQNLNSKYSFLLFGKIRKKETEQVKIIKDGVEKIFFKHYSQSIKYIQNLWSRLFNTVLYRLFEFELGTKNFSEAAKKLSLEYEFMDYLGGERVDEEQKFSLVMTQDFSAAKTHRLIDRIHQKETLSYLRKWSYLENSILKLVEEKKLRGPLSLSSKVQIETQGLKHFNSLSEDSIFLALVDVCGTKNIKKWSSEKSRKEALSKAQVGKDSCVKSLGLRYFDYLHTLKRTTFYDVTQFRKFLGQYFSKASHLGQITKLFGEENVFVHGQFMATTKDGQPFNQFFKSGLFRGLGVIDKFNRTNGTTVPVK
jgi:hypothetical protein